MKTFIRCFLRRYCCLCLVMVLKANASPSLHTPSFSDGREVDSLPLGMRIPLILIHGMKEDSTVWTIFLERFWRTPLEIPNQFKPYAFDYRTEKAKMQSDDPSNIPRLGGVFGTSLQQSFGDTQVVILSHSMGGLVARSMMANSFHGHPGSDKVLLLITLATPHHGTSLANRYLKDSSVPFFSELGEGFAADMRWDCSDGVVLDSQCGSQIFSETDFSKTVVYAATFTPAIPCLQDLCLSHDLLCADGYCTNDGAVPLQSALFNHAPPDGIRRREVAGSCDHNEILNGKSKIQGGVAMFDQLAADLLSAVPVSPRQLTPSAPTVQTTQATGVTSRSATLNATITSSGFGTIVDARFEYTSNSFPGQIVSSFPPMAGTAKLSSTVDNLAPDTLYLYRAYVKNSRRKWNEQANNITFRTAPESPMPPAYRITATADEHGSVFPTDESKPAGDSEQFTASALPGYIVAEWTLDGVVVQTGGNIYNLENIDRPHSVHVSFSPEATAVQVVVTPTASPYGLIDPSSPLSLPLGSTLTLNAKPMSGNYVVDKWFVAGTVAQTGGNGFTLGNVSENTTVLVTFKPVGDLDADGFADILFEDDTGEIGFWSLKGEHLVPKTNFMPRSVDRSWTLIGYGDFDGDKQLDLVFQHRDGTMITWFMEANTYRTWSHFGPAKDYWSTGAIGV
jgi:hypothetical protein